MLLTQEINAMLDELAKLNNAQKTVNSMDDVKNRNALMPLGGDIYLDASIGDSKSVIISVGGGYLIEQTIDEAKQFINKQAQKQTQEINSMMKNKRELEQAVLEISYRLEQISH
jgi:prefoldin alpha subunit